VSAGQLGALFARAGAAAHKAAAIASEMDSVMRLSKAGASQRASGPPGPVCIDERPAQELSRLRLLSLV
jgi:hypothetical protein